MRRGVPKTFLLGWAALSIAVGSTAPSGLTAEWATKLRGPRI